MEIERILLLLLTFTLEFIAFRLAFQEIAKD